MLRCRQNDQHRAPVAVIAHARPSAEEALTVLRQNLTIAIRIRAAQRARRGPSHWSDYQTSFSCQATRRDGPRFLRAYPRSEGSKNGSKWHATDGTNRMDRCVQRHLRRADHARARASRYLIMNPECHRCRQSGISLSLPTDSPWGRCASAGLVRWHKANHFAIERLFAAVHESGIGTNLKTSAVQRFGPESEGSTAALTGRRREDRTCAGSIVMQQWLQRGVATSDILAASAKIVGVA